MRLLLDTHVWLWLLESPARIDASVLRELQAANELVLSAASIWEMAIKEQLGRLVVKGGIERIRSEILGALQARELPIRGDHALAAAALPRIHKDPFDRMLVGQASVEELILVTGDQAIREYGGSIMWLG